MSSFFRPHHEHFSQTAWPHFWGLAVAMAVATVHTVERLHERRSGHTHRTNDGEFLWRSEWNESGVLRERALDTLRRLHRKGEPLYLILDDTQTLKRAQKMEAVGRLYHHADKTYRTGHTLLKASLCYRKVTMPWARSLYIKKEDAPKLKRRFVKLTERPRRWCGRRICPRIETSPSCSMPTIRARPWSRPWSRGAGIPSA